MQVEIKESGPTIAEYAPILNVRWGAIFAGLAVGLATNMLLMFAGTAAGLSLFDIGSNDSGTTFQLAASIWNTLSMVMAAFVGGYVAARGSGLKRRADGMLHAAVAWGMTLLLAAFLATSATGAAFNAMFPSMQERTVQDTAQVISNLDQGDRQAAVDSLRSNLGISEAQAQQLIDQAMVLTGREDQASAASRNAAQDTVRTAAIVSVWLTLSILLSLLAALGGGVAGAKNARRILHQRHAVPPPHMAPNAAQFR